MIEQLFNLIQSNSQQEIIDNPAIPNDQNNQAVGLATESIFGGLQNAIASGGLKDVLGMFAGGSNSIDHQNPVVTGINNNFIGGLMNKFGLDSQMASSIAGSLIPSILGKLVSKTNNPGDSSFDINGIIGALTGAGTGSNGIQIPGLNTTQSGGGIDFGQIIKNISSGGLDANHDGKMGLDDIAGILGNITGGQKQASTSNGGGIFDMLKGMIGG